VDEPLTASYYIALLLFPQRVDRAQCKLNVRTNRFWPTGLKDVL